MPHKSFNSKVSFLACILPCLLTFSCTYQDVSSSAFLTFLEKEKLVEPFTDQEIILNERDLPQTDNIIYLLNSHCSICIAQLISFCKNIERLNGNFLLIVIIDEGETALVDFYISEIKLKLKEKIVLRENKEYKYLPLRIDNEDLSGIIICKDELTQGKKPYLYHISRQD